jgi:regulatory protein
MAEAAQGPEARLQHALELAYRYLARRDRTCAEVRGRLEREGAEEAAVAAAIAELEAQGALDDERYARLFAEDRRRLDGWGSERIAARLEELGVPAEIVEAHAGRRDASEELSDALEVLSARMRTPPADERGRERALGLLVRRGYPLELAYDAVRAFERG